MRLNMENLRIIEFLMKQDVKFKVDNALIYFLNSLESEKYNETIEIKGVRNVR